PPPERFWTWTSCCSPEPPVTWATRSIADTRSSLRRSLGRGTVVESETVVDSNAASPLASSASPDFLRISDANMVSLRANIAPKWDFMDTAVKKAFHQLDLARACCARGAGERGARIDAAALAVDRRRARTRRLPC